MAEEKKKDGLGIPQTKGTFQVRGKVVGTDKEKFYIEKLTKTDKPWRQVAFGVQTDANSTIYVSLNGMEKESVFFSKKAEEKDGKAEVKEVPWRDRFNFKEKDFNLIGVNVGVSKVKDSNGKEVNDNKRLTEFDACKAINDNLTDGQTVFVKGKIEFGEYNDKHTTKFIPTQVSLGKDIDFDADDFKPTSDFTQYIVFTDMKVKDKRDIVSAKIVNFKTVEDAEFIIEDSELAKNFNKKVKPYTGIKVWGDIRVVKNVEEVTESDCWGEENKMEKAKEPTIRELVITGADPKTIDTTTYTEKAIDEAIAKMNSSKTAEKDFGNSTWGAAIGGLGDDEDDDFGWD